MRKGKLKCLSTNRGCQNLSSSIHSELPSVLCYIKLNLPLTFNPTQPFLHICPSFPAKISSPFQVSLTPFLSSPALFAHHYSWTPVVLKDVLESEPSGITSRLRCAALNKLINISWVTEKNGQLPYGVPGWFHKWVCVEVLCKGLHVPVFYYFQTLFEMFDHFKWSATFKHLNDDRVNDQLLSNIFFFCDRIGVEWGDLEISRPLLGLDCVLHTGFCCDVT